MRLTALDLSDQKLTKLAGIQELVSLQYLSIRKNKLSSLKVRFISDKELITLFQKLNRLPCLKLLDASYNHISKLEQLPSSILYLDLSHNRLQGLSFCLSLAVGYHSLIKLKNVKTQNSRHLRLHKNQIKSLKGLESCVQLETLFINDNALKDRNELETFKVSDKL